LILFNFIERTEMLNEMAETYHHHVVKEALAQLKRNVPDIRVEFEQLDPRAEPIDGRLRLFRPRFGALAPLAVEFKLGVTTATLPRIINTINELNEPCVLVTDYLTPGAATLLRNKGVFYLDTAGNAYLDLDKMLILVVGQKPTDLPRRTPLAAFGEAGVRLIFTLLAAPALLAEPYRQIAAAAGVAQGTITHVLQELEALGLFQKVGRERILRDRLALAARWAEAYAERLRPKLLRGRFDAPDPHWWKQVDLKPFAGTWGGEPAGALLTGHLRPETYTLYIPKWADAPRAFALFTAQYGLRRNPEGRLEILEGFWDPKIIGPTEQGTVHPLLAYADLMATQDARCIETGKIIHDEQLAPAFRH
jgi:hypothetical protein